MLIVIHTLENLFIIQCLVTRHTLSSGLEPFPSIFANYDGCKRGKPKFFSYKYQVMKLYTSMSLFISYAYLMDFRFAGAGRLL